MKSNVGETRKNVHFFTRRGDVNKTKFPTKQANRDLKGALCKNVHIISADFFIGRSAMSTITGGASPPDHKNVENKTSLRVEAQRVSGCGC